MSINIEKIDEIKSLVLCKLNKQPIGELPVSFLQTIKRGIDEIPEITLKINKYINQQDSKKKIENPMYYEIKNKRYLYVNDEEYFIIDQIKESKISGVKEITAYGGQQILAKFPINIEDIGIQILDDDIDNDIYSLNTLLNEVGWSIGHVDTSVLYDAESQPSHPEDNIGVYTEDGERVYIEDGIEIYIEDKIEVPSESNTIVYTENGKRVYTEDGVEVYSENEIEVNPKGVLKMRWQESIDNNMLDFIREDIAQQFNCLPIFDATTRTIDLLDLDTLGEEIKICLCKDNYLKNKEKSSDSEDLITLLKLKGSEELDIGRYMPSGYDFITDFSYFKETHEMSDELIQALDKYDEIVEVRSEQWRQLTEEKAKKETILNVTRTKWQISISTIECNKRMMDTYILNNDVVNENRIRVALAKERDNELILRLQIEDLLKEIDLLQESIDNINILCKYPTATDENGNLIFNKVLLNELLEFIFIDTYSDDSFVDGEAMLEKGRSLLKEKSRPSISISVDSVNFMNRIIDNGFRLKWNGELSFGDIVILIDEDTGREEFYYFIGFDIDYTNNSLTLEISNKKANRDNAKTINKWLKEAKKTKALLTSNKYLFNSIKNNRLNISKDEVR